MRTGIHYPETLPQKPDGFTKRLEVHMNFGREGGAAQYSVYDANGAKMPFGHQYDTRKDGLTGFAIDGRDGVLTWAELVAYWPEFLAARKTGASA